MESALPGRFFRVIAVLWCIPGIKRVQAPFGARVLSVMCCALTDGFRPGRASPSGLVQRGVICRLLAAAAKRL